MIMLLFFLGSCALPLVANSYVLCNMNIERV